MSQFKADNTSDLSGAWAGAYSYPGDKPPVSFSATLSQNGEWITGTTDEIGHYAGSTGVKMTATLQGRRSGSRITWLKLYDRLSGGYDAVTYEGQINEDASEITGRWNIHEISSGAFLMVRAPAKAAAATRSKAERLKR
jgi:hypothetical protein